MLINFFLKEENIGLLITVSGSMEWSVSISQGHHSGTGLEITIIACFFNIDISLILDISSEYQIGLY